MVNVVAAFAEPAALNLSGLVADIFDVAGQALTFVTGNPLLLFFFAAPAVVGISIGAVKRLK